MTPYNPIRAVTLDLDDTLWPVLPTLISADEKLQTWLAENTPAAFALLKTDAGRIRQDLVGAHPDKAHNMSWLREASLEQAMREAGDPAELAPTAFELFLAARQEVTFYDDVLPVLSRWSERYELIAISNGNADIHRVGLGKLFSGAISAHEQGFAKPDPRMFELACDKANVSPEQILHIGDDWHLDVQAARHTGMQTAWIKRADLKHDKAPPESAKETHVFADLTALDDFIHGSL